MCTGELCKCQEEGRDSYSILEDLVSRSLPYDVEESTCLGSCGSEAVVAVDFMDGTAALCYGPEEALQELGLVGGVHSDTFSSDLILQDEVDELQSSPSSVSLEVPVPIETKEHAEMLPQQQRVIVDVSDQPKGEEIDFSRERMRLEAKNSIPTENPWLKAVSYLAKKATESIL